jgi:periplasmic protein TonB
MRAWAFVCLLLVMSVVSPALAFSQEPGKQVWQKDPNAPTGSEKNPARVSSGLIAGNAIRHDTPRYPQHCDTPCNGHLVMHIIIGPDGKVARVEWISGGPDFREPVMEAVRRWAYKPYLLNGKAVWVETTVSIFVDYGG